MVALVASYPATSAVFPGQNGRQYCFYSVARDGVGYVQTNPPTVVCTQTLSNYPPALAGVANQLAVVGGQLTLPNLEHSPSGRARLRPSRSARSHCRRR